MESSISDRLNNYTRILVEIVIETLERRGLIGSRRQDIAPRGSVLPVWSAEELPQQCKWSVVPIYKQGEKTDGTVHGEGKIRRPKRVQGNGAWMRRFQSAIKGRP
jgi:hypothetical protein